MCPQIWDTCGQERFNDLGGAHYRGADACILAFDVTSRKSFEALEFWRQECLSNQANIEHLDANPPFAVFGNKVDLIDQRVVHSKLVLPSRR